MMFENHKGTFFSNCKYQLETKETFDTKKAGHLEVSKFMVGELVWFNVQRQIPDMKYNKAKQAGPCKIISASHEGLFKLAYKVNNEFFKYKHILSQFSKRFCGEPLK